MTTRARRAPPGGSQNGPQGRRARSARGRLDRGGVDHRVEPGASPDEETAPRRGRPGAPDRGALASPMTAKPPRIVVDGRPAARRDGLARAGGQLLHRQVGRERDAEVAALASLGHGHHELAKVLAAVRSRRRPTSDPRPAARVALASRPSPTASKGSRRGPRRGDVDREDEPGVGRGGAEDAGGLARSRPARLKADRERQGRGDQRHGRSGARSEAGELPKRHQGDARPDDSIGCHGPRGAAPRDPRPAASPAAGNLAGRTSRLHRGPFKHADASGAAWRPTMKDESNAARNTLTSGDRLPRPRAPPPPRLRDPQHRVPLPRRLLHRRARPANGRLPPGPPGPAPAGRRGPPLLPRTAASRRTAANRSRASRSTSPATGATRKARLPSASRDLVTSPLESVERPDARARRRVPAPAQELSKP